MMKIYFAIIAICFSTFCNAQSSDSVIVFGKKKQLNSTVLQESREYWVHLPKSYEQNTQVNYPVIYLLDGEQNFTTMIGIHAFLDRGPRAKFPEVIIVGINNTDRTRDLTPTSAISRRGSATMENSGGGENFIKFLEKELIPQINSNYRTSEKRVLVGHSFGGLLTIYTLLNHPTLFTDYLALDPSFWWDNQKLLKQSGEILSQLKLNDKKLYLARAGKNHSSKNLQKEDAKESQLDFRDNLNKYKETGLQWDFQNFENETHGSIFLIGTYYGLKYLFQNE